MSREFQVQRVKELLGLCILATLLWFVAGGYGLGNDALPPVGNVLMAVIWLAVAVRKGHWWLFAILRSVALSACLTLFPIILLVAAAGPKFGVSWIPVIVILAIFLGAAYAFVSLSTERPEVIFWL